MRLISALSQKADIAERNRNVRFVPKADSFIAAKRCPYSMTSSAAASSADGTVRPSGALAVFKLMTS